MLIIFFSGVITIIGAFGLGNVHLTLYVSKNKTIAASNESRALKCLVNSYRDERYVLCSILRVAIMIVRKDKDSFA